MNQEIEQLYQIFGRYPRPASMHHSPLAPGAKIYCAITAHALREVPAEYIAAYAFRAMTTVGGVDDFRHFLPRILELLAQNLSDEINPEIVLGKLAYGKWQTWPADEQATVRAYLHALWAKQRKIENDLDSWFCAYLNAWKQDRDSSLNLYAEEVRAAKPNGFWRDRPAQWTQLEAWLAANL